MKPTIKLLVMALGVLMLSSVTGQDRIVVIDTPTGSVILEIYEDPIIKDHFYIFLNDEMNEVWVFPTEQFLISPVDTSILFRSFFEKDTSSD